MMKKTIVSILCIMAVLLSLSACGNQNGAEDALLTSLTGYAAESFDSYTIQIEAADRNGSKVTQTHTVTVADGVRNVHILTEKINPFIVDGDNITSPEEYMTVTAETCTVNVSESNAFALPSFQFNQDSLTNIKLDTESYPYVLKADVVSTEALMQDDIAGTDFKLEIEYITGSLYAVELRYITENGNKMTVTYTFG
jgi:hypothetical protein